jgi:hypothetical protein
MHNKGETSVVLADDVISMEVSTGKNSGKQSDTSMTMSKGSFVFKLKDATMKFDESGFFVGSDGESSYFKVTKDGIELHGESFVKGTAKEVVTMQGKTVTISGSKDLSLKSNHLRLSGTQLLNLTGSHIGIEAIFNVRLKGQHIGTEATILHTTDAPARITNIPIQDVKTVGVYSEKSSTHNIKTSVYALKSGQVFSEGQTLVNSGMGSILAEGAYTAGKTTTGLMVEATKALTTLTTLKNSGMAAAGNILVKELGGSADAAQGPSSKKADAKDKKDNQSINSIIATENIQIDAKMNTVTIAPTVLANTYSYGVNSGVPIMTTNTSSKAIRNLFK